MKNKLCFHALLILCMATHLYGQNSAIDYNLSDYKLPVMKRHVLELQFSLDGQNQKNNFRNNTDTTNLSDVTFHSNITPFYSFYLNTKKIQINSNFQCSPLRYNYEKSKDDQFSKINKTYNPTIHYSGYHTYYFVKKFFVEADLMSDYQYNNYTSSNKGLSIDNKTSGTSSNFYVSLPLMLGWGRIERVEDARLAVYILNDLKKAGKIERDLTEEEITKFATLISEIKNKRFFDSREKKIYELQQLDSFLVSNNIVESPDITYFSLMNDNWDYASGPIRESGLKVSLGISPSFSKLKDETSYVNDSTVNSKITYENTNFTGIVSVQYEKPLNLYWQLSISDALSGGKNGTDQSSAYYNTFDTVKTRNWSMGNSLYAYLSYYPNSRTQMSLSSTLSYYLDNYKNLELNPDQDEKYHDNLTESLRLNIYYYISPRLRFGFNSSYYYNIINDESEYPTGNITSRDMFNNFSASASLIYKIL